VKVFSFFKHARDHVIQIFISFHHARLNIGSGPAVFGGSGGGHGVFHVFIYFIYFLVVLVLNSETYTC
jgi:hypothetical protein